MPVEITSTPTSTSAGEISKSDLEKVKSDFVHQADVKPYNGRTRLLKKFSVSIMKDELKRLIAYYESTGDIHFLKINFAVQLNPFTACSNENVSDSMTVIIETAKFIDPQNREMGHIPNNEVGDYVVIPGFGSTNKNQWTADGPCCPSSHP